MVPVFILLFVLATIESSLGQKHYSYALGRHIQKNTQLPPRGYNSSLPHPCEKKSCYPATGNLLIGREHQLLASSTCGSGRREKFCIVSHLKDSKKCFYCESNERTRKDPRMNHEVRNIIYKFFPGTLQESWWQSENGKENVTIQLDLEAEFHFTHIIIVFKTFRPAAMVIERSYDFGKTWQPYRYFASDCSESFPDVPVTETLKKLTDVICESRYSKVSPSTNGEVIFRVLPPQMWVDDPYAQEVQNLLKMTNLRINFTKLHTLGDDLLDNRAEIQEKYYYAITSMVVRGSCSCYGHASQCLPLDPSVRNVPNMVHGRCDCVHNTRGANCEECDHFYNDLPWQPAGKQTNACKRCNCNNHADSCHFDWAVYHASGNISGGVCDGCQHNTMGTHCEMCKAYFYQDPNKDIQDPEACIPCDCDPTGSTDRGICDSHTDELSDQEAGSCHCKTNVEGRRCDACKSGFWNLTESNPDGCESCTCNTLGTVDNQGCDTYTGECTCKRFVTGRDCNQCLPEFWGLSERRDGCQPCDCDPGGSFDNNCDVITGQCSCRENVQGRTCDTPKQYYFAPSLEFMVFEAEKAIDPASSQIVIREPYRDGHETTWTGPGFVNLQESQNITFDIDNLPRTTEYDIAIRYEPKLQGIWEHAIVQILRPEPIDPNGPCANTKSSDDNAPITFHPAARSVTVVPPTCLETNKTYQIRIELQRYQTTSDTPTASILIDSIVLIPRIDRLPIFRDPHIPEKRLHDYYKNCKYTYRGDLVKNQIPEICKKYHMSISFQIFNGAFPCNCNDTGSTSKLCGDYGGFCQCKTRVVGRKCDRCAPGTYGFGPEGCKPCDCSGLGARDNLCDPVTGQCKCKNSNTYGRQCDQCRPGFWAFPNCQRCECNGHADTCDLRTGACINCRDFTTGHNCKECQTGYYGDPRIGYDIPCRPCPCPGSIGTNLSHADTCALDTKTKDVVCECHTGYSGLRCETCDDNYFGHPEEPNGTCQECECSNNIDITRPGNCDPQTGECLQCLFNTEGPNCQYCKKGYYGEAELQSCRECVCDVLGTVVGEACNRTTGQCSCKPNVVGLECKDCKENYWRIALGNGCEPCDCDQIGSLSKKCNEYDGQCVCKPGFGGRQCDQCTAHHWGNPTIECFRCDCDPSGSETLQCDQNTGACKCKKGISGDKCNKCQRGFLGESPYCTECGECFTNWDLILNEYQDKTKSLISEVENTIQVGTTGAYTEQFDSMEETLQDVKNLLRQTSESIDEADDLQDNLKTISQKVNQTEAAVNQTTKQVNDVTKNITVGQINLQILAEQTKELAENAQKVKNNATELQEGNVELALTLTENAVKKVNQLESDLAQSNQVDLAKQNCKAAQALVNRTKSDRFESNEVNLVQLDSDLNSVFQQIIELNQDICDRKDPLNNNTCDSICGGAGCGSCGALSCDEGANIKVHNADLLAKEATNRIKNNDLKAQELLRNLYQINLNTSKAHDHVKNAYSRALETNKTANYHLDQINKNIEEIKKLNITNKDSPKELQALLQKILTLKITSKPEDIQKLSDKISKAATTLTDIDAILRETDSDKNRVKELQEIADKSKNEAQEILERANQVRGALTEADKMKDDVKELIGINTEEIEFVEKELDLIRTGSESASFKSSDSIRTVDDFQKRLASLKVQFLKNNRDGATVESDANKIVLEAQKAQSDAVELQAKYLEANKTLAEKIEQSQQIRDRANKLYLKATQLNVNIDGKINYLTGMSLESRDKEQKLRALSDKIDNLNGEMDEYLTTIRNRSSYYRLCTT